MDLKFFLLFVFCGICLFGGGSLLHATSQKSEQAEKVLEYLKQNKVRSIRDVLTMDLARLMASEHVGNRIAIIAEFSAIHPKPPQPVASEYKENNFVFLSFGGKVPADKLFVAVPLKSNPKLPEMLASLEPKQNILMIGKFRMIRQKAPKSKGKNKSSVPENRYFVFDVEQIFQMPETQSAEEAETQPEKPAAAANAAEKVPESEETEKTMKQEEPEDKIEDKPETNQKKEIPVKTAETPPGNDDWE